MKHLIIIAALLLAGCTYVPTEKKPTMIDGYEVATIDSCEYIKNRVCGYFSHKGNCRFCRERRERELQELLKDD